MPSQVDRNTRKHARDEEETKDAVDDSWESEPVHQVDETMDAKAAVGRQV